MTHQEDRALVLLGHADEHSFNGSLADAYVRGWSSTGREVERIALGELRFDHVLRTGYRGEQPLEPDLERVKTAIERARHVVWIFPTHWASPPALVRGLVDRLFLPGWAFQYNGGALPTGLLTGRSSRVVATMDSPAWWYTLAHHRALHGAMGTGTLRFVGFAPVQFTTVHGVREMDEAARGGWLARVEALAARDARALGRGARSPRAALGPG